MALQDASLYQYDHIILQLQSPRHNQCQRAVLNESNNAQNLTSPNKKDKIAA
jgi:hypothetical protein